MNILLMQLYSLMIVFCNLTFHTFKILQLIIIVRSDETFFSDNYFTMAMKVGVLAIQGSFIEHINSLERVKLEEKFKHLNIVVTEIRAVDDLSDDLRGLIIPGGESTTILKFLDGIFLARVRDWIEQFGRPVWGSCAGMILLADKVTGVRSCSKSNIISFNSNQIGVLNALVARNYFGRQRQSFTQNVTIKDDKLRGCGQNLYPG